MTTTRIHNVDIVTLDDKGTIHRDSDLVIQDGKISHIGDLPEALNVDVIIDGSGKVAMPGLFNSHCHAPMTLVRGWAEDMHFPQWLQKVWVVENRLTPDDVYWGAALAAAEMIRSGTVAFNDLYFFMDRVAEVVLESGMKAALAWGVFGAGEGTDAAPDLDRTVDWIKEARAKGNDRIRTYLGPHSPYTCSESFLRRVVELAHDLDQGIHLHLAETKQQVEESIMQHGLTPVEHVDRIGLFDVPGGCVAAHTLWVNDMDIEILSEKGVFVPHCPNTYLKLAMPFQSLKPRLDAGVKVCLGTDGPGSNSNLDIFASIRQTALVHKYLQEDPEMLPGDQALRLGTKAGAEAVGFPESGQIEIGAPADIILLNLDAPHMRPVHNLVANLVHSARGSDVTDVMVDGQWLMRDRDLLTLDEERILYEAESRALALVRYTQG
ncbi:MAG: amidohydrolase [Anaerolineaceae bacterium]|nr:amidohydrolase [Anaerolineaceae bacterium]